MNFSNTVLKNVEININIFRGSVHDSVGPMITHILPAASPTAPQTSHVILSKTSTISFGCDNSKEPSDSKVAPGFYFRSKVTPTGCTNRACSRRYFRSKVAPTGCTNRACSRCYFRSKLHPGATFDRK